MTRAVRKALDYLPAPVHRLVPANLRADVRHRFGLEIPGDTGYVPATPPVGPGQRIGAPDFIGLGVPSAGAWRRMQAIGAHPGVASSPLLSDAAHFFAPYCTEPFGEEQVARFHELFPRRSGELTGHWSPDGMAFPWVVPLLAQAAPDAKILVQVRDPIDRLCAGLRRTIASRPSHPGSYLSDAVERGFYAAQLTRLLDFFPRNQVEVTQFERSMADPIGTLSRTLRFLGLDESRGIRPTLTTQASSEAGPYPLTGETVYRLQQMYASDVDHLSRMVPDLDLGLWPHFAARA